MEKPQIQLHSSPILTRDMLLQAGLRLFYHLPKVHQLHDWEKKNIFVKDKKSTVGQLVSETILTFRRHLIDKKIQSLMDDAKKEDAPEEDLSFLEDVIQYQNLKKVLSRKLNRVL